jgi:hypothetical protein
MDSRNLKYEAILLEKDDLTPKFSHFLGRGSRKEEPHT